MKGIWKKNSRCCVFESDLRSFYQVASFVAKLFFVTIFALQGIKIMSCSSTRAFAPLSHSRLCENGNTLNSGFPMRIQNGIHCPKENYYWKISFPLFKGRDRPQWKVIEWRRRRNIIVDEIYPAYSDRAEIGSLKVQPQFSITTLKPQVTKA